MQNPDSMFEVMNALSEMRVFMRERMATKKDLERMAVNIDATNAEIQSLRVSMKEDLERMATKEDLERMAVNIDATNAEIQSLRVSMKEEIESTQLEIMMFLKEHMVTREEFHSILYKELSRLKWDILDSTDKKIAQSKGDCIRMLRKESDGASQLVTILHEKEILTQGEQAMLLSLQPFPRQSS